MGIKRSQQETGFFAVPERIEKIYYKHGLFCSSHPIPVICFAIFIILLCSYPLLHLRLPGNSPQEHVTPFDQYKIHPGDPNFIDSDYFGPKWFQAPPLGYVLQIFVKTIIFPPKPDSSIVNHIRSSLKQVFEIVNTVRNYQHITNRSIVNFDDVCLHVTESIHQKISPGILPHYGCLIVSPANLWKQDLNKFLEDNDIVKTILGEDENSDSSSLLKDILFGVPWNSMRVNRISNVNRASVFMYAVTLVFEKYDANFTEGLHARLQSLYSISDQNIHVNATGNGNITHVYFHDQNNLIEFIPLLVTYVVLFLYIYFSVRKIELVKSKLGMAFSAVVTVIASLCMSIGICTWFGLSFTLKSGEVYLKEIFPYLVVIIGLENILILTKSIVSTPVHLDVKLRVAQGLSKEGWSITKNLCTEITILTFGFFTFVPAIQEFCLFAVVGLLSDFFLQLVFFATILSIDVRRMEQSLYQGIQTRSPEQLTHMYPLFRSPVANSSSKPQIKKSRSCINLQQPPRVVTAPQYKTPILVKLPKRLRLVYFWARCRIFQRAFMITFVVWIFLMSYRSGIVEHFSHDAVGSAATNTLSVQLKQVQEPTTAFTFQEEPKVDDVSSSQTWQSVKKPEMSESVPSMKKGQRKSWELWRQLSPLHWPTLFGYYNISIQKRYLSMLPPIPLTIRMDTLKATLEQKLSMHLWESSQSHPDTSDKTEQLEQFHLDGFLNNDELIDNSGTDQEAIYPSSPQEVILTVIFAIPSLIFVVYVMIVLYRCVCTRNYAEWRSSWSQASNGMQGDIYTQLVLEAMPIVLEGHPQEIECMTTDDTLVVSSCLSGQLRVWDSSSGECVSVIDRRRGFVRQRSRPDHDVDDVEDVGSDYGSGSPPSRSDFHHEFAHRHLAASQPILHNEDAIVSSTSPLHRRLERDVLFSEDSSSGRHCVKLRSLASQENLSVSLPVEGELENMNNRIPRDLFKNEPNLSSSINTDFRKLSPRQWYQRHRDEKRYSGDGCYDFSRFDVYYNEHGQSDDHLQNRRIAPVSPIESQFPPVPPVSCFDHETGGDVCGEDPSPPNLSPVWCLDCRDGLIAVGCSDGRIEVWDSLSGNLKCIYHDEFYYGVTGICLFGNRIVASRLHGGVDFLELRPSFNDTYTNSMHRRSHVRHGSSSSLGYESTVSWSNDLVCVLVQTVRAHQQPITKLKVEGGRAVTGSQDHSLKVFRVEDGVCQLTLHGHHGPITALFIDKLSPMTAASGAQDGAVCLWDLLTGACVCRLQGHDGIVAAITYTEAYVLSAGEDTRLLVWERFQGHLLNTINLQHSYCSNIVMLTDTLLLTARQGSLVVWDIRVGEPVRIVRLGHTDQSVFVRQIQHVGNAIVCDYGNQLRVVQFPTIVEKAD